MQNNAIKLRFLSLNCVGCRFDDVGNCVQCFLFSFSFFFSFHASAPFNDIQAIFNVNFWSLIYCCFLWLLLLHFRRRRRLCLWSTDSISMAHFLLVQQETHLKRKIVARNKWIAQFMRCLSKSVIHLFACSIRSVFA